MPNEHPGQLRRWALASTCLLALAACGTQPTGHGAPPYEDGSARSSAPVRIKTHYPALALRFSLPGMSGSDRGPVQAYVRFTVAATRSTLDGAVDPAVQHWSTKTMREVVATEVSSERAHGYRWIGPVRVDIRAVSTSSNSTLKVCIHNARRYRATSGTVRSKGATSDSVGVFLSQRTSGRWYVAAIKPLAKPLHHC